MKINYTELINILEHKSNHAITRLDKLKSYTPEFQETLRSILKILEALKEIERYDCDCLDCKEKNEEQNSNDNENQPAPTRESQIGKPYKTFKEEDYE